MKQPDFVKRVREFNARHCLAVPSLKETREFTDHLIDALFPIKRNLEPKEEDIAMEMEQCAIELK